MSEITQLIALGALAFLLSYSVAPSFAKTAASGSYSAGHFGSGSYPAGQYPAGHFGYGSAASSGGK